MDGLLELASRNLLLDADLKKLDGSGRLLYWPGFDGPPSPVGRNVYAGFEDDPEMRQTRSLLPFDESAFWHIRNPRTGPTAPLASPDNGLPQPEAASLKLYRWDGRGGYPGGQYGRSYAWVTGSLTNEKRRFLTAPAPRKKMTLAAGESYVQPLREDAPPLASGVAILQTKPGDADGPLFVQRVVDVRDAVPEYVVMDGLLRTAERAPNGDQTHRGGFEEHPAPEWDYAPANTALEEMDVEVSYRITTPQGASASQKIRRVQTTRKRERALRFRTPPLARDLARGVIWQIRARDGLWYDLYFGGEESRPDEAIRISTDDPVALAATPGLELVPSERYEEDSTGIPNPDAPLPRHSAVTDSTIRAGEQSVRITDVYETEDGRHLESPASAPATITSTAGDIIRVGLKESQLFGNLIPNDAGSERDRQTGGPIKWTLAASLGVTFEESVITFDDSSAASGNVDAAYCERFPVDATQLHAYRAGADLSRATNGAVSVVLTIYASETASAPLDTVTLLSANTSGAPVEQETTIGPSGAGGTYAWPGASPGMLWVSAAVVLSGGARNLAGEVYHLGLFAGGAAPRKRRGRDPVSPNEAKNRPYSGGNYLVLVEDPSWTNGMGNGVEFYGAAKMPVRDRYLLHGLEIPVEGGQTYCLSAHYSVAGSSDGARIMPVSVHNAKGRVIARPDAVLEDASGTHSGRSHVRIDVPEEGEYVRVNESALGAGLVRVWGLQFELGAAPTAWTNDYVPEGSIAVTFDTAPPGYEGVGGLPLIFSPKRWIEADAVTTEPAGTGVSLSFRSRDAKTRPWEPAAGTTDLDEVVGRRYLEVTAILTTSDLDVSPTLSAIHLLAELKRAVLLRPDGSHYHGGVLAENVPAGGYAENTELSRMSDGSLRIHELFPASKAREITVMLKALTDEGADEVMLDSVRGDRLFRLEGWGLKRELVLANVRFGVNRRERLNGLDYWMHVTDELVAPVMRREKIDD